MKQLEDFEKMAAQTKLSFRPRARIIRTIGDQLISGPEAAVIELVKNSYDADASMVEVKFVPPLKSGGGRIIVSDDGHGMALEVISERWMEPATSSKLSQRRSPKGRIMMGSKGIGRFAAAKLGRKMSLLSTVRAETKNREVLIPEIDWDEFSGDRYLSEVEIDYLSQETPRPTGTVIEIREFTEAWSEASTTRLLLELRRLVSPLSPNEQESFKIYLDLSECTLATAEFDGKSLMETAFGESDGKSYKGKEAFRVRPYPLLTVSDYELSGHFNLDGGFDGFFTNKRAGLAPQAIILDPIPDQEGGAPGPFDVRLYLFDREAEAIKSNMRRSGLGELSAREARHILDEIAGVAIYRNGFRVRPYGDRESDWLLLDRRRVQDPSRHIGHNQVAGYVTLSDHENLALIERSSREGFEENTAFRRLQDLLIRLLTEVAEPRRQQFREQTGLSRKRTGSFTEARKQAELKRIRKEIIPLLAEKERAAAELILADEAAQLAQQIDQLEDRQRVLEAGSSLGAIVGEVLHEGSPLAAYMTEAAGALHSAIARLQVAKYSEELKQGWASRTQKMEKTGNQLVALFRNLRPLAGGKRKHPEHFNPFPIIEATIDLFRSHHGVEFKVENPDKIHSVLGYRQDLSAALLNLVGNSIFWLEEHDVSAATILIKLRRSEDGIRLFVEDNGPGIPDEFVPSIFDVGFSLKPEGTGLGLNIAREALARSGAVLSYHPDFKQGAKFEILYPTELTDNDYAGSAR
ncbi:MULTISPECIES: sensor histidine kinase [unclassified Mesorhizobium]|uniref:sensor histidine kinase n=1 Tax=unclassified Mesorhizobium TaxID=325217 RepID=UPI0011279F79|nr:MULTISPECIES: sensor histidine kinase [unclassified Mesorhizobium]TPI51221.1 sensor histidine kinase [Mesorhizobium sp. B3-1-1]TPJ61361.1 sensor histidine kinase [Mesorhizobium sp. B2-6-7]TPJ78266.1 sensor histidine kinase [Mesorhizobium sp. B2-6-3]TPJ92570.1 sensor histidine kinase [Mesorhizobium sp. B2-5-10]TPK04472.1 sensor histidine kinase [Mesorhizobium sp. B2-5-11]